MEARFTPELSASLRRLRESLSPAFRRNLRRLAGHLHRDIDDIFGEILTAALADKFRKQSERPAGDAGPQSLQNHVVDLLGDGNRRRIFERRYLRYHLRHRQRLVRPTWANIFVNRLSAETCALWVTSEREGNHRLRSDIDLGEVVYLSEEAFREYERDVLLPALRQMAVSNPVEKRGIAGLPARN